MKPRTSVQKRALELSRLEKKQQKEVRRQQRKTDSENRPEDDGEEDPDLAGIVPGPQAPPEPFRE